MLKIIEIPAYSIEARIAQAQVRCGQLRHIFDDSTLNLGLKIRLYIVSVCSIMTFGAETWDLNKKLRRRLNTVNSVMLARISGKSIQEEARHCSTSFNLVKCQTKKTTMVGFHSKIWSRPAPISDD